MAAVLAWDNIHFQYPTQEKGEILAGVSLLLKEGERIGILGENGSGKSTLFHISTGLLKPSAGCVSFLGKECRSEQDFRLARPHIGYLLQHSEDQLFCPTVLEDVAFGSINTGMPRKEAAKHAQSVLEKLGLGHLAGRTGHTLSGGEQKLCALASLLSMPLSVLLLDEPTNDLDKHAREILIHQVQQSMLPALVISHDTVFLKAVCTRLCYLENGVLREGE